MNGFLFVDKEKGETSFDVVAKVRRLCGVRRVGHAGTLDPLATGLLVVAIGEGTKLLEYMLGQDKEYLVKARFGAVSDTFDADGEITNVSNSMLGKDQVEAAMGGFRGEIMQVPPKFSALKIGGRRAYDLARQGKEFEMHARPISIHEFELMDFKWPVVNFRVRCGSGTYIRSLVHDLGGVLGCGAYIEELRRTEIGEFSIKDAISLNGLDNNIEQHLLTLEQIALKFSGIDLSLEEMGKLKDGKVLMGKNIEQGGVLMAFVEGKFVGILENGSQGGVKFRKLIV